MKLHSLGLVLGLLAVVVFATAAQDQGVKIAVVDLEQALVSTEEGKAAREELERKMRESQSQLEPMLKNLQTLEEELKSKQFVLSEEALRQKRLDYVELGSDIEAKGKELEGKFKVDQQRVLGPLQKKLFEIVQEVGKEQGFTLILARNAPGLVYAREAVDITDIVIQKFNKKG